MSIHVSCGECGKGFKAPAGSEGKSAKCPNCGAPIVIRVRTVVQELPLSHPNPTAPAKPPKPKKQPTPPQTETAPHALEHPTEPVVMPTMESMGEEIARMKGAADVNPADRVSTRPVLPYALAAAAVALVIGYFGGREHLKWEMRSAMQSAADGFRQGMDEAKADRKKAAEELARKRRAEAKAEEVKASVLVVNSAELTRIKPEFGMAKNVISLRVHNTSRQPISRVTFRGRYQTAGRSVPWLEEEISYDITGGLEADEIADWKLSAGFMSGWGRVEVREDAELIMTPIKIETLGE